MMGLSTRWKGKGSKAMALGNPVSELITKLQASLSQSKVYGLLSGSTVLLEVGIEQADLLNRVCFGCPIITASEDTHWYELSLEEAFYLFRSLNCIKIVMKNRCLKDADKLWNLMKLNRESFSVYYKAYSHLRAKNWVVRSGIQYGVDFVAYSHHPSLVHSEYAVIVSDCDGDKSKRLLVWPEVHATVRLEGGVAKTLLLLHVRKNGCNEVSSSCLEHYTVEESTITRWSSEQCREDKKLVIG
ncbi:tRNA-intron lyase [Ranunculus cassubicifolius]